MEDATGRPPASSAKSPEAEAVLVPKTTAEELRSKAGAGNEQRGRGRATHLVGARRAVRGHRERPAEVGAAAPEDHGPSAGRRLRVAGEHAAVDDAVVRGQRRDRAREAGRHHEVAHRGALLGRETDEGLGRKLDEALGRGLRPRAVHLRGLEAEQAEALAGAQGHRGPGLGEHSPTIGRHGGGHGRRRLAARARGDDADRPEAAVGAERGLVGVGGVAIVDA